MSTYLYYRYLLSFLQALYLPAIVYRTDFLKYTIVFSLLLKIKKGVASRPLDTVIILSRGRVVYFSLFYIAHTNKIYIFSL